MKLGFFQQAVKQIVEFLLSYGVIGLGIGTFIESLGVPFGDLVFQLGAGQIIRTGRASILTVFLVAVSGLILGSLASYCIGYFGFNLEHRISQKPPSKLMLRYQRSLEGSGFIIVLLAQLYGPTRTWISIPSGAAKMDIKKFTLATAIGGSIYCIAIIYLSIYLSKVIVDTIKYLLSFAHIYVYIGLFGTLLILIFIVRRLRQRTP